VHRHHHPRRTRREQQVDIEAVNALIDLALATAADHPVSQTPVAAGGRAHAPKRMLAGHRRLPRRRIRIYRSGIGWRRLAAASDSRA
jgi:hypothetical protein